MEALIAPPKENQAHAVIMNSGGIDSRVLAKLAKDAGYTLHSLFIDANREIRDIAHRAAQITADLYCADHEIFQYPLDWTCTKTPSGLFGIPFLAMAAHTHGAQYAVYKGFPTVFVGARSQGRQRSYLDALTTCLSSALMTRPVQILAPLFDQRFEDVYKLATENGVDISDTYSCTHYPPCGACRACSKRKTVNL